MDKLIYYTIDITPNSLPNVDEILYKISNKLMEELGSIFVNTQYTPNTREEVLRTAKSIIMRELSQYDQNIVNVAIEKIPELIDNIHLQIGGNQIDVAVSRNGRSQSTSEGC